MQATELISFRPEIPGIIHSVDQSREEQFQHTVLRPILKLLNERLIAVFKHYLVQRKQEWENRPEQERLDYIEKAIKTDSRLQAQYLGLVIAWMTAEEYVLYTADEKELSRRIRTLLIQRLQNQIL